MNRITPRALALSLLVVAGVAARAAAQSPLALDGIEPVAVSALGGTEVTIRGTGFTASTQFFIGTAAVPRPVVSRDGTRARAVAPPLPSGQALGAQDLVAVTGTTRVVRARAVSYVDPPADPLARDVDRLRLASERPVTVSFDRGRIRSAILRVPVAGANPVLRARSFLDSYAGLFGLDRPHQALVVRKVGADEDDGEEGVLFQQTYRGVPVYGGTLKVSMRAGHVFSVIGSLLRPNAYVDERPTLGRAQAEAAARRALARPDGAPLRAATTLVIFDLSLFGTVPSEPRLAWQVTLGGGEPWRLLVDAKTGEVRHGQRSLQGSGGPLHGFDFDLQDAENEANAADDWCFNLSNDTDLADEDWYYGGTFDVDAQTANLFSRETYSFFHENFSRHSYDNDEGQVEVFVRSTTTGGGGWNDYCETIEFQQGWPDEDAMTHEFTHGIIQYTSELHYAFASGALNESYADVMGALSDREFQNGSGFFPFAYADASLNWTIGEDLLIPMSPPFVRSLMDPTLTGQPNHTNGFTWGTPVAGLYPDNGNVHFNSGIPNLAKSLMANGGTHPASGVVIQPLTAPAPFPPGNFVYPTRAMGAFKMKRLAWSALKNLSDNAVFTQARDYEVAKAADWATDGTWGYTAEDACTVTWAWAAVGVGLGDADCDGIGDSPGIPDTDGDGVPNTEDNCVDDPNSDQKNTDNDLLGDECDPNDDNDPFFDGVDFCPLEPSYTNHPCGDSDWDGVQDDVDNCPVYNPDQADSDGNGFADACDDDVDGDGVGAGDNCPLIQNPGQADSDGDMIGNICDQCPNTHESPVSFLPSGEPNQPDSDGDGFPDACEPTLGVGGPGGATAAKLVADGISRSVDVEGRGGTFQQVALDVCPSGCPEERAGLRELTVHVTGLEPEVVVYVHDDQGRSVGKEHRLADGQRRLRFRPQGGRSYVLSLGFTRAFGQRPAAPFAVRIEDGDAPRP